MPTAAPAPEGKLNVLILGDSLALCGFGKRLDSRFRADPQVNATFTYMACGTNPLSWLKHKPYEKVRTQCGYWSIEPSDAAEPHELRDSYGMGQKGPLKPHFVPKLEEIFPAMQPDVLVIQTGSNLFGLFPDMKTVKPSQHSAELKKYLLPFKAMLLQAPSNLRKIYWVNPTTSGRVSKEVQDFLLKEVRAQLGPEIAVIDSRPLVSYPYQHMEPDKEHFTGAQMDEWADKVFAIVQQDLAKQPIAALKPLREMTTFTAAAAPQKSSMADAAAKPKPLVVEAKLVFKSQPMQLQELLPYQESLVAYVYDVTKVSSGEYHEKQIMVMHPSFIALKPQRLDKFQLGKAYKLRLHPLEGTLWSTAKSRDDSGQINLQPFIRVEDNAKHPNRR
ncbi:MAG TPA: hypothetical protein VF551_08650 [Chthoniobacterales bacterium]